MIEVKIIDLEEDEVRVFVLRDLKYDTPALAIIRTLEEYFMQGEFEYEDEPYIEYRLGEQHVPEGWTMSEGENPRLIYSNAARRHAVFHVRSVDDSRIEEFMDKAITDFQQE
jgi:hypothetical protein